MTAAAREVLELSNNLLIRNVQPGDFKQWKSLWDCYNAFYGRKGETALPESITNMTWSRFFDGYEPMHALVAEQSGMLLGLAHFLFHRSTILLESTCYLQDLFTHEAARGQGIGRALIEEIYRHAKHAGCHKVYWQTQETNVVATRLYDKVADKSGFIVYRKTL
jgi:GNAT superfamily N-acetyltransferase